MTELNQVYKCQICGNIVIILHAGAGELVCCGEPMKLMQENTEDAALEKHVPVVGKTDTSVKIKIGKTAHPMTDEHYIKWIEILANNKTYRKYLQPRDLPEAEFCVEADSIIARAYCNLHGLWKG